jgi:hypothetical protein
MILYISSSSQNFATTPLAPHCIYRRGCEEYFLYHITFKNCNSKNYKHPIHSRKFYLLSFTSCERLLLVMLITVREAQRSRGKTSNQFSSKQKITARRGVFLYRYGSLLYIILTVATRRLILNVSHHTSATLKGVFPLSVCMHATLMLRRVCCSILWIGRSYFYYIMYSMRVCR